MKQWLRDNRGFLIFLLLFGLFRTAVADWNPIPSGSMRPTLREGDVVFVNRLAYQLKVPLTDVVLMRTGEVRRGDIVTFSSPSDGTRLIKRVIGLPGDVVKMRNKVLFINGQRADYLREKALLEPVGAQQVPARQMRESIAGLKHEMQWFDGRAGAPDFGPLRVPADHYLMLGDNRDDSADSRYFGLVARNKLIGRAERVLVSVDMLNGWRLQPSRFGLALR
ncbi:MAG TPA: signal peptidase I [Methylibium sp.]